MSLIHIRSKENDFEISYSENPINLSGLKGEIALKTASLWYSWDNITEEYKNNEIKFRRSPHERSEYKSGKKAPQTELKNNEIKKDRQGVSRVDRNESEWKILKLPNGLYDENELNNYIQEYFGTFETPPFNFDVNYATNRFMLIIRDKDYEIDFSHVVFKRGANPLLRSHYYDAYGLRNYQHRYEDISVPTKNENKFRVTFDLPYIKKRCRDYCEIREIRHLTTFLQQTLALSYTSG
ncbi:hypothetical protein TcasGA2_TC010017 [Tribolium castaneum]|uniref:Uncharacterized protein n=1 Tax=Tribolium castaneum TaxID=7070 RepID=D6WRA9_TRICA|nr:hypothetical protein TcasGA2_TC010017 [Tribolium castaneum]